ncbi:MAG: chemotaxis protein CheW [Magnetospirillum sp.]|nr:chemotaxis protein CheW [Magnetospirillum sp.]
MASIDHKAAIEVVTFALDGEIFALEAGLVREILDAVTITRVPGARPFIDGLINVRGKVVPLADLRLKFGMAMTPATHDTRIIVIEMMLAGEPVTVGVLADKVYEVTTVAGASVQDAPEIGMSWNPDFVKGIGKRDDGFIIIPDIEHIFAAE